MANAPTENATNATVKQPQPMFYRFEESLYSDSKLMLTLASYRLISTTPAGVWIDVYGMKKFVLLKAFKRYACPTVSEALASYHARKKRQIKILRHQLARAEAAARLQRDGDSIFY